MTNSSKRKPFTYWQDKRNHREFFDHLATKWNIQKPEDWYRVTARMVVEQGGNFIHSHYDTSMFQGRDIQSVVICMISNTI
jgi:hypothetical protein